MFDSDQAAAAAQTLLHHWRDGTKFDALADAQRPATRAEGYAVQAALQDLSGQRLFGWKIAATSEAGQHHINVAGPLAGRIYANKVIPDGGTAPIAGNAMRMAEPEFAFRMGRDLLPRTTPYSVAELLDAVETLHPAIELPDSRFANFAAAGEAQLAADHACAHLFVLGPATDADWRGLDLVEERPVVMLGEQRFVGHGRNVLGDPRIALAWLANELGRHDITLRAGEVVTTGTCHVPLPIAAGDHVAADFGRLGKVSVSIV